VGIPEAILIHREMGLKYSEFLQYTKLSEVQFQEAFTELLPSGKSLVFRRREDRACCFASENGCLIFQIRPIICRLFPYWYEQDVYKQKGTFEFFLEERECQLISKLAEFENIEDAFDFIDTSVDQMERYFKKCFKYYEMSRQFHALLNTTDLDEAMAKIEHELEGSGAYPPSDEATITFI
jgi:Fe-S-cluster containining protein